MNYFIPGFENDGIITVNELVLKDGVDIDELQEKVAHLCSEVKTWHSETGFVGGYVSMKTGLISNAGSTVGQPVNSDNKRIVHITTFWNPATINGEKVDAYTAHEQSHLSDTFQPLFEDVLSLAEQSIEPVYELMWAGGAYNSEDAKKAQESSGRK